MRSSHSFSLFFGLLLVLARPAYAEPPTHPGRAAHSSRNQPKTTEVGHAEPSDQELRGLTGPSLPIGVTAVAPSLPIGVTSVTAPAPTSIDDLRRTIRWAPSNGRSCSRYKRRRVCDGPKRVPLAYGEAQARAQRLGLDARTGRAALFGAPDPRWLAEVASFAERQEINWPVDGGELWRGFGFVRKGSLRRVKHEGVDIGAREGTTVLAAERGLVLYSDNGIRGYGNVVMLLHAGGKVTLYAHCRANYVFAGQFVQQGQPIGEVGATGLAKGPHLHFELRENGRSTNPLVLMDRLSRARQPRQVSTTESVRGGRGSR